MTEVHRAIGTIPDNWRDWLGPAASPDTLAPIGVFVAAARRSGTVFPCPGRVFAALEATPYASIRAVILGQDPYSTTGYADGLAFSVPDDLQRLPRSLRNIRAEWQADLGLPLPEGGSLEPWTRHGVLLLNTDLTVMEVTPGATGDAGRRSWTRSSPRLPSGRTRSRSCCGADVPKRKPS